MFLTLYRNKPNCQIIHFAPCFFRKTLESLVVTGETPIPHLLKIRAKGDKKGTKRGQNGGQIKIKNKHMFERFSVCYDIAEETPILQKTHFVPRFLEFSHFLSNICSDCY